MHWQSTYIFRLVSAIGFATMQPIQDLGKYVRFVFEAVRRMFFPPVKILLLLNQMEFVGNRSLMIIVLAGCMVGGIFGFQLGDIFETFGTTSMMGAAAAYVLSREMAPVTSAMLVAGRAGSAMAAEIAIMRVNEQIDAMRVMAVNPHAYLIAPRVLASVIMLPLLSSIFVLVGVFTAFIIGIAYYDIDVGRFVERISWVVDPDDIMQGLQKAFVFGFIIASIGCYKGFFASGGARGVGKATTTSVVLSLVFILIFDFIISYIQFRFS